MAGIKMLNSRFRGCLVGACIGDCLGRPFENIYQVDKAVADKYFKFILKGKESNSNSYKYTDDTAMTRSIADSLINFQGFNPKDMAHRFQSEYFKESFRGYGENVRKVFCDLRDEKYEDIYESARKQFNGRGSYGNGAAMRTSPVALYYFDDEAQMIQLAMNAAQITHSNQLAITGAVLLSLAIKQAMSCQIGGIDAQKFVDELIDKIKNIDVPTTDDRIGKNSEKAQIYVDSLEAIKDLLKQEQEVTISDVIKILGNGVAAHKSVPTAIYSFLRGLSPIQDINETNEFARTLYLSILIGGDTDTIASMAGSIAGAYSGMSGIPTSFTGICEGIQYAQSQADQLFQIFESKNIN